MKLMYRSAPIVSVLLALFIAINSVIPSLQILLSKYIIDALVKFGGHAASTEAFSEILYVLAIWGILYLLSNIIAVVENALQGDMTDKIIDHIYRLLIIKSAQIKDLYGYEDSSYHDDLSILQSQSSIRPTNLVANCAINLKFAITILSMIGVLLSLDYRIPIILLVSLIPHLYVTNRFTTGGWLALLKTQMTIRKINYYSTIMLSRSHIKEIQLFNLGNFFLGKHISSFQEVYKEKDAIRKKQALSSVPTLFLNTVGNVVILYIIVKNVALGNYTYGAIAAFVQALFQINYYLVEFITYGSYLNTILQYFVKLFSFLDWKSKIEIGQDTGLPGDDGVQHITFKSVSFCYPHSDKKVLDNVSFVIKGKEKLAIVGENGAGKTTIVKLLLRYYDPDEGEILYNGKNIKTYDVDAWRGIVSAVFQDYGAYHISLLENIGIGDMPTNSEIDETRSFEICKRSGFDSFVDDGKVRDVQLGKEFGGMELSGGEWQRLAIARAFYRDAAKIMVMDEPTASMDPIIEAQIYNDFRRLSHSRTTIMITHRLGSVTQADNIIVLKDGRAVEYGNHEALLEQNGLYKRMFDIQAKQYKSSEVPGSDYGTQ